MLLDRVNLSTDVFWGIRDAIYLEGYGGCPLATPDLADLKHSTSAAKLATGSLRTIVRRLIAHLFTVQTSLVVYKLMILNNKDMVEAAGVEPASEKVRNKKTTRVADSKFSGRASESARVTQP